MTIINTIENLIALIDIRRDDFLIKWRLSDLCNYRCSYCIRNNRGGDKRKPYTKEDIINLEENLCKVAKKISSMLKDLPYKHTKISIIGGEPSIFNLKNIFSNIEAPIEKIVITTNLSQSAEYYVELYDYLNSKGIELSLCGSFHPSFTTEEEFFNKVKQIISKNNYIDYFSCEMVSNIFNQEKVQSFKEKCLKLNVDYKIEKDLINTQYSDYIIQESSFKNRSKDSFFVSYDNNGVTFYKKKPEDKDVIEASEARYLAIFADDSYKLFGSRNEFLTKVCKDNDNLMPTGGKYYCTNSYNFINIEGDKIIGRLNQDTTCHENINTEDFNILSLDQCLCNEKCTNCSLCGSMSIAKDVSYLKFNYEF